MEIIADIAKGAAFIAGGLVSVVVSLYALNLLWRVLKHWKAMGKEPPPLVSKLGPVEFAHTAEKVNAELEDHQKELEAHMRSIGTLSARLVMLERRLPDSSATPEEDVKE